MDREQSARIIEVYKNLSQVHMTVSGINDSYNPAQLMGRTNTEIDNLNKTLVKINRACNDVHKFLERGAGGGLFS